MQLHDAFEWDRRKAEGNRKKHGITFEDAEAVLGDDDGDIYHVDVRDDDHSEGEDRYITFGSHPADRRLVLRISWTTRIGDKGRVTRIISARPATRAERKQYAKEIRDQ